MLDVVYTSCVLSLVCMTVAIWLIVALENWKSNSGRQLVNNIPNVMWKCHVNCTVVAYRLCNADLIDLMHLFDTDVFTGWYIQYSNIFWAVFADISLCSNQTYMICCNYCGFINFKAWLKVDDNVHWDLIECVGCRWCGAVPCKCSRVKEK